MKRKIICILCSSMLFMLFMTNVKAGNTHEATIHQLRSFIYTFDDLETEVQYLRDLKDVNDNISFELYEIIDEGYAIVAKTNGNIVDIQYGDLPDENDIYYLGPNRFVSSIQPDSVMTLGLNDEDVQNELDEIKEATEAILSEQPVQFEYEITMQPFSKPYPDKPDVIKNGTEIGIPDANMNLFNDAKWIVSGDRCGAYAGACLLTYMQKYYGGYFKPTVTIDSSATYANYILNRFFQYITGRVTTNKVVITINQIMLNDNSKTTHTATRTTSETTYKSQIQSKKPVLMGLIAVAGNGNTYGNHFVVSYRYVDYNNYLWFKAYDGWSGNNNRGWINRNWIVDGVYLV